MQSDNFDLQKYIGKHKLTLVQALRQAGYQTESYFLERLLDRNLDQYELYQLLIENKMAFGTQKALAKDVNKLLRKRLRRTVATLGNVLKDDLLSDEIKEVASRELERVKRLREEIEPLVVNLGAPAKEKDFINSKIAQLADYLEDFTNTGDTLADEHRLIAALFNTYNIGEGEWTEKKIQMRLYHRDHQA